MKEETITSADGNTSRTLEDGKLQKITTKKVVEEIIHIGGTHMVVPANNDKEIYIGYLKEVTREKNEQVVELDDVSVVTRTCWTFRGKMLFPSKSVLRIEVGEYAIGDTSYIPSHIL